MSLIKKIKSLLNGDVKKPNILNSPKISILSTNTDVISADFSQAYSPQLAENSKFVVADTSNPIYSGYPANGMGKYSILTYIVNDLSAVDFSQSYSPGFAENGKFVQLNLDPSLGWPAENYPKYAVLSFIVNPNWLSLSGGVLYGDLDMNGHDILNVNTIYAISSVVTNITNITGDFSIDGNASMNGCLSTDCIYPNTESASISVHTSLEMLSSNGFINMQRSPITNLGYIDFNLTDGIPPSEGRLKWNVDDGTLEVGMPGGNVNLQIGQEQLIRARANENILNGQAVYIDGAYGGQRPRISLANASSEDTSHATIGIATEDITLNQTGFVTLNGLVRGINTSNLPEGEVVYLDTTDGGLVSAAPIFPNHPVKIGYCINQHLTEGILYVDLNLGQVLNKIHDVLIVAPTDGDMLTYNAISGGWFNDYNITDFTTSSASNYREIETIASTQTIATSSDVVLVDATIASVTAYLPEAANLSGKAITVKKIDGSINTITLSANTNIDGFGIFIIANQYDAIEVVSNGTQWWII